jgi:hypothetical protein
MNPSCSKQNSGFNKNLPFNGHSFFKIIINKHLQNFELLACCSLYDGRVTPSIMEHPMTAAAIDLDLPRHIEVPRLIHLDLDVRDPETILELSRHPESDARISYALAALRLGSLALRQASGVIDSSTVRMEGERLVATVRELLTERSNVMLSGLSASLKQYFDPSDGQLPQRLDRLLKRDGELESMLGRHLNGEGSTLARTLAQHIGEQSPLLRILSPKQSDGILKALTDVLTQSLHQQREQVIGQFSLDKPDSALSRLIGQITDANGRFRSDLAADLTKVCAEFSLDNDEAALRRMCKLMETTNATVKANLTLDDESSPLACLRRELMQLLGDQNKTSVAFQTEIRTTLEAFKTRRDDAAKSTLHGGDFENAVGMVLTQESQRIGDIIEHVGHTAGTKSRCKTGDYVVTLGPDSAAPGSRFVCEAKSDKSYTLASALAEIAGARENRDAEVGIFVFSTLSAPSGLEPLTRYGNDIVVLWDQDDPATDVFLYGAMSVAKALAVRQERAANKTAADFTEIESAVSRIANDAKLLQDISTHATTVKNSGQKILEKTDKVREDLEKQIDLLQDHLGRLKADVIKDTTPI